MIELPRSFSTKFAKIVPETSFVVLAASQTSEKQYLILMNLKTQSILKSIQVESQIVDIVTKSSQITALTSQGSLICLSPSDSSDEE